MLELSAERKVDIYLRYATFISPYNIEFLVIIQIYNKGPYRDIILRYLRVIGPNVAKALQYTRELIKSSKVYNKHIPTGYFIPT